MTPNTVELVIIEHGKAMIAFLLLAVVYGWLAYKFYQMEHGAYKFLVAVFGLCVGVFIGLVYYEYTKATP